MAEVVVFPYRHRRGSIRRLAALMKASTPEAAERRLAAALRQQAETMARRGFAVAEIERQLDDFESAVRAAIWRSAIPPRDAS